MDVKKVLEQEPLNKEARALARETQVGQKLEDQKSKGLFNKSPGGMSTSFVLLRVISSFSGGYSLSRVAFCRMCGALGKGPIPEPFVDRRFDFDAAEREASA